MNIFEISTNSKVDDKIREYREKKKTSDFLDSGKSDLFGRAVNSLLGILHAMPDKAFFLLIFLFQGLLTLQGLDLSDEGFMANFFHGIFRDPMSLSYNFMFWLTGVIGGIWMKFFGFLGLWGVRMAGALVNTLTLLATYRLLKKYIQPSHLKLGLLCVILCLNNDIKILNYNTLSSLTFVLLAGFLLKGLFENRNGFVLLAGVLVCLNSFIRIPNVLQLGLVALIAYHNWSKGISFSRTVRQSLIFAAGFAVCFGLMLLVINMLGHQEAFRNALDFLFNMSNSNSVTKTQNDDYGMQNLVRQFLHYNLRAIFYALIVFSSILAFKMAENNILQGNRFFRITSRIVFYAIVLTLCIMMANQKIDRLNILLMICGIPLLILIPFMIVEHNKDYLVVYLAGIFFLLTFPAGSSHSILTAGRFSLWIALPIALDFLMNLSSIFFRLDFFHQIRKGKMQINIPPRDYRNAWSALIVLMVVAGLIHQYYYPFFDWHNRKEMTHAIDNDKFRMIYTSQDRAAQVNELFAATAKYSRENDYILTYDRIPMLFYATNTQSFLSNSFPGVYRADLFEKDLNSSLKHRGFLPVVVQQLIHTTGQGSRWPTVIVDDEFLKKDDIGRDQVMNEFLRKNDYREVWKNECFRILVPRTNNNLTAINTVN
jgi:hypothetical protein